MLDSESGDGEHDENDSLDEDGSHGRFPLDFPGAVEADDVVGKVGVQSCARIMV